MKNYWLVSSGFAFGIAVRTASENITLRKIASTQGMINGQSIDDRIKSNNKTAAWYMAGGIFLLLTGIYGFKK